MGKPKFSPTSDTMHAQPPNHRDPLLYTAMSI